MSPEELRAFGLQALSVVGFANIIGTLLATHLGTIFPKPYCTRGDLRAADLGHSIVHLSTHDSHIHYDLCIRDGRALALDRAID